MKPSELKHIPLVSVIMPLYNKRLYVNRAIESIGQQTFTDWELIIVDDGSTDGSVSEIQEDDERIRLFQQPNAGPGAARNRGIKMARGDLVTFLDADDYYYPQKLETEMTLLFEERRAEWMMSALDSEKNAKTESHRLRDISGKELPGNVQLFNNAFNQLSVTGIHIDGLSIKKHLLEKLGGFNEEMRCFEISEFITRCYLMQPEVLIYPEPLYRVRKVPDSAFNVLLHRIESMRPYAESMMNLGENYPEFSSLLKDRSQKLFISYASGLIRLGRSADARKFLNKNFPYPRDRKWWKLLIATYLPHPFIQWYVSNHSHRS